MLAVGSRINANSNNNQYNVGNAIRTGVSSQDGNITSSRVQPRLPKEAAASINGTAPKWPFAAKKIKIKNRQQVVARPIVQLKPEEPAPTNNKKSTDFDAIED